MPAGIAMRHRTPHFQHIFSGGYSAAYYSYLWSEVLDADGFEAFEESGDIFDPDVARRLRDFVYAAGGRRDYDEAYRALPRPRPVAAGALPQARAGGRMTETAPGEERSIDAIGLNRRRHCELRSDEAIHAAQGRPTPMDCFACSQ